MRNWSPLPFLPLLFLLSQLARISSSVKIVPGDPNPTKRVEFHRPETPPRPPLQRREDPPPTQDTPWTPNLKELAMASTYFWYGTAQVGICYGLPSTVRLQNSYPKFVCNMQRGFDSDHSTLRYPQTCILLKVLNQDLLDHIRDFCQQRFGGKWTPVVIKKNPKNPAADDKEVVVQPKNVILPLVIQDGGGGGGGGGTRGF
ncbi:hypothetical protein IE53DRAFT_82720 [Violaceomyces palustris]|uniref:Uncharacterized protein n=1 Tax=Violaceomyces palustris TaxID=1673888 RepID=A0ACD0NY59_9BASI|nr:hypothetical protein IE53DRAFT_82720 [Violaceomyces palustris]